MRAFSLLVYLDFLLPPQSSFQVGGESRKTKQLRAHIYIPEIVQIPAPLLNSCET